MSGDTSKERQAYFYLSLGMLAGSLVNDVLMDDLINALKNGDIRSDYVRLVRDKLASALDAAELEERRNG